MLIDHVYIGNKPGQTYSNHTLIPQSTVGNAGLHQIDLFALSDPLPEQPDRLIYISTKNIPCPKCGEDSAAIKPGKGPHAGKLECAGCGHHLKWLSKSAMQRFEQAAIASQEVA